MRIRTATKAPDILLNLLPSISHSMISPLNQPSGAAVVAGRLLSFVVTIVLLADAGVCLFAPELLAKNMEQTGFPTELSSAIGGLLAICTLLFAVSRTSVLGAILITGFLGGAICTHFRMGEFGSPPQIVSVMLGVAAWASIYLRMAGARSLLALTNPQG